MLVERDQPDNFLRRKALSPSAPFDAQAARTHMDIQWGFADGCFRPAEGLNETRRKINPNSRIGCNAPLKVVSMLCGQLTPSGLLLRDAAMRTSVSIPTFIMSPSSMFDCEYVPVTSRLALDVLFSSWVTIW